MRSFGLILVLSFSFLGFKQDLSAQEILQRSEKKLRAATVVAEMSIDIIRPKWSKHMEIKAWVKGTEYAAAYVLAPAEDEGTVFLKNKNDVWNYLPKIKKTIKLPMNMLSQSWMGSDLTTDDLIYGSSYSKDFNATLIGSENFEGRNCHSIELLPKEESQTIWSKIELLIDLKDFIQLRTKYYDEDFELVNTVSGSDIKELGGKNLASRYTLIPTDNPSQKTTLRYSKLTFDHPLTEDFFKKDNIALIKP